MKIYPAWLAGFIDGEGCLDLYKNRSPSQVLLRLTLINTHLPTLQAIQNQYGGRLYKKLQSSIGRKQVFGLTWSGNKRVRPILEEIRPFLRIKREQAELLFEQWFPFVHGRGSGKLPDGELDRRLALLKQMQCLKRHEFTGA